MSRTRPDMGTVGTTHRRSDRHAGRSAASRRNRGVVVIVACLVLAAIAGLAFAVASGCAKKSQAEGASKASSPVAAKSASAPGAGPSNSGATPSGSATAGSSTTAASSTTSGGNKPEWQTADPSWMDKYKGKLIYGFKPEPGYKAVALTFDDGPNGETQFVIDTLKQYGGQATFFDSGRKLAMSWAKTQPSIIDKAGFEIANHTQHHTIDSVSSLWHRTYAVNLAEINGPDVYVQKRLGKPTVWLRPMGGMIDATGIKAASDTGHLVINWTIDSNDSHGGPRTPDYIYQQVVSNIKSGDVVLLHVTHPESMKALPRIAAELDKQGFKMVTVSELAQHSASAITGKIPK